ncbi:MAG TPA: NPCBM/NEW2 domain-containing protein, partial [Solirubrobacteraceae bacterium]|nr:NPCBM/NEW2 domain-containing protein [Solirubrobacteraceae bacterium]
RERNPLIGQLESWGGEKSQEKNMAGSFEPVYLDDLPKEDGGPVSPGDVSIGGHVYEHGLQFEVNWIGTEWEASYAIPHGAHTFSAIIGNDDKQTDSLWKYMSLFYEVLADGHLVGSGHTKGYAHDGPIHADVAGKARITLKVTVVSGLNSITADWADPVFR